MLLCAAVPAASGQTVVDRVAARGVVHCGGVARPGLAQEGAPGQWSGLLVDVCRALAAAVLGAPERTIFRAYVSEADFDRVRRGEDDVYFLSGGEINAHGLAGFVLPGPTVFVSGNGIMVPGDARERRLGDLAGTGICFRIGEPAERSLESWFEQHPAPWLRHAFSEDGEMIDAYAVGRCHAVAGEFTWLAQQRQGRGAALAASRILPDALNVFPIVAASGTQDARWAAILAWTIDTLVNADRPETRWYAGGERAMPAPAPQLGLAAHWQERVVAATGSWGAIFARNLGPGSALRLEPASPAAVPVGSMPLMPFVE